MSESCDLSQCTAPPASLRVLYDNYPTWLNEHLSPLCLARCWSGRFRPFCQDCSDIHAPGKEEKKRQCSVFCKAHGTCPLAGPAEKAHPDCPAYDPSLRDARVALLTSLGATVLPNANHGIDVYGINIKEPWVLSHAGLLCAIQDLTHDYLLVNFKKQDHVHCETDLDMCYALGKAYEGKHIVPTGPRIHTISNHPLLGVSSMPGEESSLFLLHVSAWDGWDGLDTLFTLRRWMRTLALPAPGWHVDGLGEACTHGIFAALEVTPGFGPTGLSIIPEVLKSLPRDRLEYWKRIWWHSTNYVKLGRAYPLLMPHPTTRALITYAHNPVVFGIDLDKPHGRMLDERENESFRKELHLAMTAHSFNMSWEGGDFAYIDNLALLHKTWPENAANPDLGIRVLRKATCRCFPIHSLPLPEPVDGLKR
eukprot:jgi/Mesvir1/21684/Mv04105-RA.1